VSAFNPPEVDVLDVVAVVALEPEPLDPQPAASSSAEQAIAMAGRPLLIGTILSRASLAFQPNGRRSR
jgi:hypothetical protein